VGEAETSLEEEEGVIIEAKVDLLKMFSLKEVKTTIMQIKVVRHSLKDSPEVIREMFNAMIVKILVTFRQIVCIKTEV